MTCVCGWQIVTEIPANRAACVCCFLIHRYNLFLTQLLSQRMHIAVQAFPVTWDILELYFESPNINV